MELYPAIDIRSGRCVRLVEGDFDRETVYGDDPVEVALRFAAAGAAWIHVVDLDAARSGEPLNRPVVASIARAVSGHGVRVQCGGGVRSQRDAEELLSAGVERVVLGTAAVETPKLVEAAAGRWPGRVAVGLDHRAGELRVRGWEEVAGRRLTDLVPEVISMGAAVVIVTDISRDGRLEGPDVEGLSELLEATGAPIVASGGVSSLDDVKALAAIRDTAGRSLEGVIAGRAVYEGRLDVSSAISMLSGEAS
jgi:phosphoribosylformimino-5-aminoimidazole carboxamide ribotide isomerase